MGLINKSTPPLLRGIGTLLVLGATVVAFMQARRSEPSARGKGIAASAPAETEETMIDEVVENRGFEWGGFCGTIVIASSFFAEAWLRRNEADDTEE